MTWILDAVRDVDPVLRTLLTALGIFLETSAFVGLIVPGDSIVLVSATAVSGAVEFVALIIAVILGALAGESLGFVIGRWFGHRIHDSWIGTRIGERHWSKSQRYFERRGGIAVFVSRFLPVLHSLVPITAGMSTMHYARFMAWTVPASVIWSIAYVTVGSLAAGTYRELASRLHGAGFIFAGIIAVFLILVVVVKKILERAEAKHMTAVLEAVADGTGAATTTGTDSAPAVEARTETKSSDAG